MFRPALIVHGGAGTHAPELTDALRGGCTTAITAGWQALTHGGSAVDAVCVAVAALEDDPAFNAGVGSCLTSDGSVEMDASVMEGAQLRAGAVTLIRTVRNPVHLARAILEDGRHVMMAGPEAEALACARGLTICRPEELVTPRQLERWRQRRSADIGTVGAVAVDGAGHVAAATSTGGVLHKRPGRVGDSAIVGAGTYADDGRGAASATGHGEAIIRVALAVRVIDLLADGTDPMSAARHGVATLAARVGGTGGIIVVDRLGRFGFAHNTPHMTVGYMRADQAAPTVQV